MATYLQTNPLYYSLSLPSSSTFSSPGSRTVVLHKRANQQSFGVYVGQDVPNGLYVVTVELASPAAEAKIQPGDRVLAINGQPVSQMTGNPKKTLMDLAIHSQSLSLTIQSSDIFQQLNLPEPIRTSQPTTTTTTTFRPSSQPPLPPRQPYRKSLEINSDLEGYIKTLFGDENIQILPSTNLFSNSNEFVLTTGRTGATSLPDNRFSSTYPSRHNRPHHHRHHRHSKRVSLRTIETQTTFPDDNQFSTPIRTFPPTQPTMGTSHMMLKSQKSTVNDNVLSDTKDETSNASLDSAPEVRITRPSPPIIAPAPVKKIVDEDNSPPQHMVDIVQAAMDATRARDQEDKRREQERQPVRSSSPIEERPSFGSGVYSVRQAEQKSTNPYAPTAPTAPTAPIFPPSIKGENLRRVHLDRSNTFNGYGFHLQYNKVYYLVHRVENGSPSETGRLRPNDVIHSINDKLTEKMPHSEFVNIVNNSSQLDLIVQNLEDFQRAYPQAVRNPTVGAPTASSATENGKASNSFARALNKLSNGN